MAEPRRKKAVSKAVKNKPEKAQPDRARSAQDRFLGELAQEQRKVVIFLTNGIKLEGEIKSFDEYTILIEGAMTDHVYKHAVSTIQPLTGVVNMAKVDARKSAPRSKAGPTKYAALASGTKVAAKEENSRQPVIVVRPKRRLIKTVANDD